MRERERENCFLFLQTQEPLLRAKKLITSPAKNIREREREKGKEMGWET